MGEPQPLSRIALLHQLIGEPLQVDAVGMALTAFAWDSEELVVLSRGQVIVALEQYGAGELLATDVETWANALEGRDDIGFERGHEEVVQQAVFELANPYLVGALTHTTADDLIVRLST